MQLNRGPSHCIKPCRCMPHNTRFRIKQTLKNICQVLMCPFLSLKGMPSPPSMERDSSDWPQVQQYFPLIQTMDILNEESRNAITKIQYKLLSRTESLHASNGLKMNSSLMNEYRTWIYPTFPIRDLNFGCLPLSRVLTTRKARQY